MAVRELDFRPEVYAHFPDNGQYRWLELADTVAYGHAAFAERVDFLEMHISLNRWGPAVLRNLKADFEWLKAEARRLGKKRITGIRADDKGEFDKRFFKFARLYGFMETCVFQTASIDL